MKQSKCLKVRPGSGEGTQLKTERGPTWCQAFTHGNNFARFEVNEA